MKLIFCLQLNIEGFFKLILSFYVRFARHAYITQNNKVAFSLQYITKKVSDEIDCSHVDKHESSLQINTDTWWEWSNIPKVPKISSLQCLTNISKSKLEMKLFFLHADKHQSFLQVYFNALGVKVSYKLILFLFMSMIKHSQSTQTNKFAISLQYLKKGKEFIFCI